MPDQNQIPWYRRPEIMVILIAAIIAAIGVIIAAYIGIIGIMPSSIDGPELATVQGTVTDNDGKPVKSALVEINGSSVTTGSDGRYVIHGVPINTKTITVRVAGAEVVKRALRISKDTEIISCDITLPPPVTPPMTPYPNGDELKPFATVQGIVTDNNGKPVIGALIEIDGLSDRTGSDGGYVIHGVPINTKTITVRAHGVEVVKYVLRISKDTDILSYDITLPPPKSTPTSTTQITPSTTPLPTSSPTPTPTPWRSPTPGATTMPSSTPTPRATTTATPTPWPSPTPTPTVTIKIAEPKDGGDFPLGRSTIVGTLSNVPDDQHLWIVLSKSNGSHYPFDELYIRGDTWEVISYGVGEDNMEKEEGDTFIIGAYLLDERANKEFEQYVEEIEDRKWGGLDSLPEGATRCDEIEVIGRRYPPIILTYHNFDLNDVCTPEDNYCGWANAPGKAVVYGSMTIDIHVPEGASELEVTISISCNGYGEGLSGPAGSAANIRVDSEERVERIDSTMSSHHGNYYRYEWCNTFSNTFNVRGGEEITLKISMSGGARLDFEEAILTFS